MPNILTKSIKAQISDNLLAILSVIIALTALSYNSWRNELSEDNRTIRAAGFEILRESATLQFYVDSTTYYDGRGQTEESQIEESQTEESHTEKGHTEKGHTEKGYTEKSEDANTNERVIQGWVSVNLINQLAELVSPQVKIKADELKLVWSEHWHELRRSEQANEKISRANFALTHEIKQHLQTLK